MTIATIALGMCALFGGCDADHSRRRDVSVIQIVHEESLAAGMDPNVVAAVVAVESAWNPKARGARGEIGLMQLLPGGAASESCRDLWPQIWSPRHNVRCGVRLLARARAACPDAPPVAWLGKYNRPVNKCRETRYSKRVLKAARRDNESHVKHRDSNDVLR